MEQHNESGKVKASPAARRIAKELGLDLEMHSLVLYLHGWFWEKEPC